MFIKSTLSLLYTYMTITNVDYDHYSAHQQVLKEPTMFSFFSYSDVGENTIYTLNRNKY